MTERRITKQIIDTSKRMIRPVLTTGVGSLGIIALACSPNPEIKAENVTINGLDSSSAPAGQAAPLPKDANQSPTLAPIPTATPTPITTEKTADQITNDREAQRRRTRELEEEACRVAAQLAAERIHYDNLVRIAKLSGQPTPQAPDPCREEVKPTPKPPEPKPTSYYAPEIPDLTLGIRLDPYAQNCQLVDRRTGAIINPQAPTRINYTESGVGQERYMTTSLNPGQVAVIQGWKINGQGNGVFRAVENNTNQVLTFSDWVRDGAVSVLDNKNNAAIEFCRAINAAAAYNWARNDISIPNGWQVN